MPDVKKIELDMLEVQTLGTQGIIVNKGEQSPSVSFLKQEAEMEVTDVAPKKYLPLK